MRGWFLAILLHGSIVLAFVLFLLWNAGKFDRPAVVARPLAPSGASGAAGGLPVVPVLKALDDSGGRSYGCWRGYRAMRSVDHAGAEHILWVRGENGLIAC